MIVPPPLRLFSLWASVLVISACTTSRAPRVRMIDVAPINAFQPWGSATLATYPREQAEMEAAAARYLEPNYDIVDRRTYVASAFSRVLQSDLHDVLVRKLGGTVVDRKIPEGLGNIKIWKRGDEYFAVASSSIIYPGANAVYGYYELSRRSQTPTPSEYDAYRLTSSATEHASKKDLARASD